MRPDCSKGPRERGPLAVLFDFNGVLVDDEHLHYRAFRRLLAPLGVRLSRRLYDERYLSFDDLTACAVMLRDAGLPRSRRTAAVVADLVAAKRRLYRRLVRAGDVGVEAGARLLVRRLSRRVPLAVVSGAARGEVLLALGEARLLRRFACIVAAEDVRRPKPHPEGYRKALRLLAREGRLGIGAAAGRCVAIEDSPGGIAAARAAGLGVVGIATSYRPRTLRAAGAFAVVSSLRRPDRVLRLLGSQAAS